MTIDGSPNRSARRARNLGIWSLSTGSALGAVIAAANLADPLRWSGWALLAVIVLLPITMGLALAAIVLGIACESRRRGGEHDAGAAVVLAVGGIAAPWALLWATALFR